MPGVKTGWYMKKNNICLLTFILFICIGMNETAEGKEVKQSIPNPHWDKTACLNCHNEVSKDGKSAVLKYEGNYIELCNSCHTIVSKDKYIHAVAMTMSEEMMERMPDEFKDAVKKDKEGRLTCVVCHELIYQCFSNEFYRKTINPQFFRGGPYTKRSNICYHCHDSSRYERLNPHDQITDEGDIMTERCTYCHEEVPDRKKAASIKDVKFRIEKDLNRLCIRCHAMDVTAKGCIIDQNSKPIEHIITPSNDISNRMDDEKRKYILPVEPPTGKIFCGTCHNPHEIGVQRLSMANMGADSYRRLRMDRDERCISCHGRSFNPVAPIVPDKHPEIKN